MTVAPSRVNFNNVTSMGVSYEWSHGMREGAPLPCPNITSQSGRETGKFVERIETIDLEVANLDLENNGGNVVAQMAAQQAKYVNTATHSIYTNGIYAGNGYLTSYGISEGSLSNSSVTSLSYSMREGGEDPNAAEKSDDPVTRSENIKVSRDIKGKSYTIDHSYSVSYGSDWDLVTNYPLYSGDPVYRSVDGRLAIAQQEATAAVENDISDYGQYIDLSAYTLGSGFDLTRINDGCSGVFSTSNSTKNFINGDFSYSKSTILRYTGQDLDPDIDPYEISYTVGWDQTEQADSAPCITLTFDGQITANEGSVLDCSAEGGGAGTIAESGFKEWVAPDDGSVPRGLTKVIEFFTAVSGSMSLPGTVGYPLVEKILTYRKKECTPSVDKGAKNDGSIDFSFTVSNCPDNQTGDNQFQKTESTSVSFSQGGCDGRSRRITEIKVDGSVNGQCGRSMTEDGTYQKWNLVEGEFYAAKAEALLKGPPTYEGGYTLRLSQESEGINKYEGNGSYSYVWTDSPKDENCDSADKKPGNNPDYEVSVSCLETPRKPRYVNTVTADGIVSEKKGFDLAQKTCDIKIDSINTGQQPTLTARTLLDECLFQANANGPSCAITSLSVNLSKTLDKGAEKQNGSVSVGGINT